MYRRRPRTTGCRHDRSTPRWRTSTFLENCTPGYYNNEGQPNGDLIRRNGAYAPGIMAFSNVLDAWRAEGKLAGLEFARS